MNNYNGKTPWPQKDAHVYPSLEDFHPMVDYALTISPTLLLRSDSVTESVIEIFSQIMPCFARTEWIVRPEISTKSTILHYHGIVRWVDRKAITNFYWYNIRQLKSLCTFTIKTIDDTDVWHKYCVKQRLHMKEFMQQFNIRYRLTSLLKSPYVKVIKKQQNPLDHIMTSLAK